MSKLNKELEHIRLSGRSLRDPVLAVWVLPPASEAWNPVKFSPRAVTWVPTCATPPKETGAQNMDKVIQLEKDHRRREITVEEPAQDSTKWSDALAKDESRCPWCLALRHSGWTSVAVRQKF